MKSISYKNNTIEFMNTNMRLAVTDGGWTNVLKLSHFLNENEHAPREKKQ